MAVLGRQLPLDGGGKCKGECSATDQTDNLYGQSQQHLKRTRVQEHNSKQH
jgi:hypothetical protein